MKKKYYAYLIVDEKCSGIVNEWSLCQTIIKGKRARYKSFKLEEEARQWLEQGAIYENKKEELKELKKELEEGVYFDAGTGRGIGVEVRVTDRVGISLLDSVMPQKMINSYGNYLAPEGSTNNYGELIGLFLALDVAKKLNLSKIYGDSKLVLDYWSKGYYNRENLNEKTVSLIQKTIKKRLEFEEKNGLISYISGDINPADLGFHK